MKVNQYFNHFKQDPFYSEFLSENFDLQKTISLIKTMPYNEQITKLALGIECIKSSIKQLTSNNCEKIFQRTIKLDELYDELRIVLIQSQNLMRTLKLMRTKFTQTQDDLDCKIQLLSRLQKTCDLLRKMTRIMHLMERINAIDLNEDERDQLVFLKELIKLSQHINEMDALIQSDQENKLSQLQAIRKDLEEYRLKRSSLCEKVDGLFQNNLQTLDLNIIGTCLQVYSNLNTLNTLLGNFVEEKSTWIKQSLSNLFDNLIENDMQSNISSTRQNNLLRNSIRNNFKILLENSYIGLNQIATIIKILKRCRDNQTQTILIEMIEPSKRNSLGDFWQNLVTIFSKLFERLFKETTMVKKLIESDYPKILQIFLEYGKKFSHEDFEALIEERSLRSSMKLFENAYLSNSLSILFESVNHIFHNVDGVVSKAKKTDTIPSEKDVDSLIKEINQQILFANFDIDLLRSISRNVVKTINLFLFKCEQLVSSESDSTQVIDKFTNSQRNNCKICHILNYFGDKIKKLVQNESFSSIRITLNDSIKSIDNQMLHIFEPLILSVQDAIEDIILTIHNENYQCDKFPTNEYMGSLYMKELQSFIQRVSTDYFQAYPQSPIIVGRIHEMTSFVIEFFLLQNCLVRPIDLSGRTKISNDFKQFELIFEPICQRFGDHSRSFQIMKAFQTLLLLPPESICQSELIEDSIPKYLIIHFLVSNYTCEEMRSPHHFQEWSINRYSKWIFQQSSNDSDRITIIRKSLKNYVEYVKRSQKTSFFQIYPLLNKIMEK
ncbi:Conserved oligomeric Golgi complex subunit 5 [Sarcoptes scabiei]|uniref:Conserved oligomeric Golgi complex subunit 5 n=1 Tax=Sarcoptes scabiei TaxID=52283 RepID=A0A834VCE7_SARSC|nr:Conserved oligomeric Golgi complex subunit 5 [Sarcoptes scabiei]